MYEFLTVALWVTGVTAWNQDNRHPSRSLAITKYAVMAYFSVLFIVRVITYGV